MAAARTVQEDSLFFRGKSKGAHVSRIRSSSNMFCHGESRKSVRSIHLVLRDPTVGSRLGTGIAFQDSDLWLADETIWQRACPDWAQPKGPEKIVAANARDY